MIGDKNMIKKVAQKYWRFWIAQDIIVLPISDVLILFHNGFMNIAKGMQANMIVIINLAKNLSEIRE